MKRAATPGRACPDAAFQAGNPDDVAGAAALAIAAAEERTSENAATGPAWLHVLPTCPSTNTWAREHAAQLRHGDCVWTTRQTAGRGRDGSVWASPPGVLTASFALHGIAAPAAPLTGLLAGLAVALAVEELCPGLPEPIAIKWPNDCLLSGGKLAGVLCEGVRPEQAQVGGAPPASSADDLGERSVLIVGIGLNIDPAWSDLALRLPPGTQAARLADAVRSEALPAPRALLTVLRRLLCEAAGLVRHARVPSRAFPQAPALSPMLTQLRQRDALRGRTITLALPQGECRGRAVGLDDTGRLRLRTADGERCFDTGSVVAW